MFDKAANSLSNDQWTLLNKVALLFMQLLVCVRIVYNFTNHLQTVRFLHNSTVTRSCTLCICRTLSLLESPIALKSLSAIRYALIALLPMQGTGSTKTTIRNQWRHTSCCVSILDLFTSLLLSFCKIWGSNSAADDDSRFMKLPGNVEWANKLPTFWKFLPFNTTQCPVRFIFVN